VQFKGRSKAGPYGDTILEIDSIVGRLLDKVRALGIERDTIVFLTSDNGPWFEGSTDGLRDRKGGAGYDGGYRVPLIAWGPDRIRAGARTDAILCGVDFLPTFCRLAELELPEGVELDGRDVTGVLTRGEASPHEEILLFNNEDVVAVRTQRWKYVDQTYFRKQIVSLTARTYPQPQLYDMTWDRAESYSVAENNPAVVSDMQARLRQANATYAQFRKGEPRERRKKNNGRRPERA
jgi:arylsulfatase A-like enzyme